MDQPNMFSLGRRSFVLGTAGLLGTVLADAKPAAAQSAARKSSLVIGLDISDAISLDPARVAQYSNPLPCHAAYESLVTYAPGEYVTPKPAIATEWAWQQDGKTLRFKLRQGVKFPSGKTITAEDVAFSFMRVINLKDQPQQYIAHVDKLVVVDEHTVDMVMKDPTQPILSIIAAPEFIVMEKAVAIQHGATDAADAKDKDIATNWLNENSCGSGAYRLTGWQRNQQIQMVANPNYHGGKPGYERVLIRHMSESAAQLLALERGDIDIAFNLIPEQIAALKTNKDIEVVGATSLDFIYMAVAASPDNPALQNKKARQAIGYAIDYDGIINNLIGGHATRPVSFLPVGVVGSTEALTKEIGFR
jgi:peptide/nickel transport system substrate-binding protein